MVAYPGQITGDLDVTGDVSVGGALDVTGAGGYVYAELDADGSFTAATATASDLSAPLVAGATYTVHAAVILTNTTGNTTVSWTGPAGATMQWCDTTASTDYADTIDGTNVYAATASTRLAIFVGLLKTTTTAGSLTLTLAVDAGTTTLGAGSFLRLDHVA